MWYTSTPRRNNKWERCDIKHKTKKQDQQVRSIILKNSVVPPAHTQQVFLKLTLYVWVGIGAFPKLVLCLCGTNTKCDLCLCCIYFSSPKLVLCISTNLTRDWKNRPSRNTPPPACDNIQPQHTTTEIDHPTGPHALLSSPHPSLSGPR